MDDKTNRKIWNGLVVACIIFVAATVADIIMNVL